ncbi:MAG TPA: hypothetical protein VHC69_00190 [Polyangiaceae bacterium]|nr:hypothetical protein [Polyangiaceae bacterium]
MKRGTSRVRPNLRSPSLPLFPDASSPVEPYVTPALGQTPMTSSNV